MAKELLSISYSLPEIDDAAVQFARLLQGYRVFAFSGEMGAGKTTFIHHLCDVLQVEDAVSSPTFALINEYHFPDRGQDNIILHMDWYRLRDAAEAIHAGMEDALLQAAGGRVWCFVEWPEKARELLPTPYAWVTIDLQEDGRRVMRVEVVGA